MPPAIVFVHAGAGNFSSKGSYKKVLHSAVEAAMTILHRGSGVENTKLACLAAIQTLENDEITNAGFGSALNKLGKVECDAGLMDGDSLSFGGVASVSNVKNPILGAASVLNKEQGHVEGGLVSPMTLVGHGAEEYCCLQGVPTVEPSELISLKAQKQHQHFLEIQEQEVYDTVGAVVMDQQGHIVAGVSSGGLPLKIPGRMSHASVFGAGCWAHDEQGIGISTSGKGEQIMRVHLAQALAESLNQQRETDQGIQSEKLHSTFINLLASSDLTKHYQGTMGEAGAIIVQTVQDMIYLWVAMTTPGMAVGWQVEGKDVQSQVFTKPGNNRVSIVGLPPVHLKPFESDVEPCHTEEKMEDVQQVPSHSPIPPTHIPPIAGKSFKGRSVQKRKFTVDWSKVDCAASVALHFHQPQILAGNAGVTEAEIVSNVAEMQRRGEWDATKYLECYERLGKDIIPRLVSCGLRPCIMVEYSGTLLWGLREMGRGDIVDSVKRLATDPSLTPYVEMLGCPWGHAVAPSTPVQDYKLHVQAWQHHFAAEFGQDALKLVKGFSPSEMAIPNDPDVAYAFVETLLDAGYTWVLVQEHTVEMLDGGNLHDPSIPHRMVCKNSQGKELAITCIVKTQGSDTKLVGQMQPWYEAKAKSRANLGKFSIPRIVTQISDGENGGVIMNEFPPKFESVVEAAQKDSSKILTTVSEYLDYLNSIGCRIEDFPAVQPKLQHKIWQKVEMVTPETVAKAINELKQDSSFHMEGGSWTNDISWVRGYADVLGPMEELSVEFHQAVDKLSPSDARYQNALYHLLMSQTSCYRYWGSGMFTDFGKEIIRRGREALKWSP